jgi:hypothetical protein
VNPLDLFQKLLLVLPELNFNQAATDWAVDNGLFGKQDAEDWKTAWKTGTRFRNLFNSTSGKWNMSEKSVLQRIMLVAPELMSVQTVDLLRSLNLISVQTGHAMRAGFSATGAIKAAVVSDEFILTRMFRLVENINSRDLIDFIANIDASKIASMRDAMSGGGSAPLSAEDRAVLREAMEAAAAKVDLMRSVAGAGRVTGEAVRAAFKSNDIWYSMMLFGDMVFSEEFLQAALKMGVIPAESYTLIRSFEKMGMNVWRKAYAASDYDSWFARGLLLSEGVLSSETIAVAKELGWIDDRMARNLNYAARGIRVITRNQLSNFQASRKYRVMPGESPLQTYARVSRSGDRYLLSLLDDASKEASRRANELARSQQFGKSARSAQQRLVSRAMHEEMRNLGERMGPMIIFQEKRVKDAAIESTEWLQREIFGRLSEEDARSLRVAARSGLDSFVSRSENRLKLSRAVYRNVASWSGQMDREISLALLQGLSAKELADRISRLIRPDVRGGVSYAAMRLARTEINNAFHFTQIRYTREMPWVDGYQWHTSGSHGPNDVCDEMAGKDHDGLGRGVYKKKNVPGKPHPQCLCYLTNVVKKYGDFEKQLKRGSYDRYLGMVRNGDVFPSSYDHEALSVANQFYRQYWPGFSREVKQTATQFAGSAVLFAIRNPAAAKQAADFIGALRDRMGARMAGLRDEAAEIRSGITQLGPGSDPSDIRLITAGVRGFEPTDFKPHPMAWSEEEMGVWIQGKLLKDQAIDMLTNGATEAEVVAWYNKQPNRPASKVYDWYEIDKILSDKYNFEFDPYDFIEWAYKNNHGQEMGSLGAMGAKTYAGAQPYKIINSILRSNGGNLDDLGDLFAGVLDNPKLIEQLQPRRARLAAAIEQWERLPGDATDLDKDEVIAKVNQAMENISNLVYNFAQNRSTNGLNVTEASMLEAVSHWLGQVPYQIGKLAWEKYDRSDSIMDLARLLERTNFRPDKIGDLFAESLDEMFDNKLTQSTILYRTTTGAWMGLPEQFTKDQILGMIGQVFSDSAIISTEMNPSYYNQVTEWYGTVRYKIFAPEGMPFGLGNAEEHEYMLRPGTRFQVLSAKLGSMKNEDGDTMWDVEVLALPNE